MIVLGINGIENIFHDASATLVMDGEIVASVEEERFNRNKHTNGVPFLAIEYCLKHAGLRFSDVDHIGYYLNPEVLQHTFFDEMIRKYGAKENDILYMKNVSDAIRGLPNKLRSRLGVPAKAKLHYLNHHLCHAASSFYVSGMKDAAVPYDRWIRRP
jgi:carbamoyltransferase